MPRNVGPHWANPRFIARLNARLKPVGECLEWQGYVMPEGYGQIGYGDKNVLLVHRAAWEIAHQQDAPAEMKVCHSCDNRRCGRDEHLFLGTHEVNMADMRQKGRSLTGERSSQARLREDDVREIVRRYLAGEDAELIARDFNISASLPRRVARGARWAHIWTPEELAANRACAAERRARQKLESAALMNELRRRRRTVPA